MSSRSWSERLLPQDEGDPLIQDPRRQYRIQCSIFGMTLVAWILALVSVQRCSFIKIGESGLNYSELDARGIFTEPVYDDEHKILGCISYASNANRSGSFKSARAFAVIMAIAVSLAFVLSCLMFLCAPEKSMRKLLMLCLRVLFPICFVFNVLIFSIFAVDDCKTSDFQCPPGGAGIACIVNSLLLLALTILVFLVPAPSEPAFLINHNHRPKVSSDTPEEAARTSRPAPKEKKTRFSKKKQDQDEEPETNVEDPEANSSNKEDEDNSHSEAGSEKVAEGRMTTKTVTVMEDNKDGDVEVEDDSHNEAGSEKVAEGRKTTKTVTVMEDNKDGDVEVEVK